MCGINGLFHFDSGHPVEEELINRMRRAALHRGPDDNGVLVRGNVGLGFNRLSIIDLSGGHQPMANEDETVWTVFNGEIYNFASLREDLLKRGHRFRTNSDTETIVHAWEEFGERCVDRLRGMFAFAIWDSRQKVLFVARDRLGIKPLYYHQNTKGLAFASEMKSLLVLPEVPRVVDPAAVMEFLRHRYAIAPNTILKDVKKLEPGHTMSVTARGVSIRRYWDVPMGDPRQITEREAIEEAGTLIKECVRMHLVSDVPLGAFLSGGIDSSVVVGLMHKLGVEDIKTFSIGYDSPESELKYARIVADHFHTDHHELRLTPIAFQDILPKIVWHMDEPVGDQAAIPLYYLAAFARQKVTVALSGEGSDELFGGYPIYARMLQFERWNRVPGAGLAGRVLSRLGGDTKIRKYAQMLGQPLEQRYGGVGMLFTQLQADGLASASPVSELEGVARAYERFKGSCPLSRMAYVDLKTWLADDLLVKADRMSMAHSLELRVPFLDHTLVEFAARLPSALKIRNGVTKYVLKKWSEPLLPREIVYRSKKGFPVPTKSWFRGDLAGFAREALLATDSVSRTFFSAAALENLLAMHQREDRSEQIYSLLVFDAWNRNNLAPSKSEFLVRSN
jgi:asparagine synthase (glutamine-hydrolysing)